MKTVINPMTGDELRVFEDYKSFKPTKTKKEVIREYVLNNPDPNPDDCVEPIMRYYVSIKGENHIKYYQPTTGKSFLDTNYFENATPRKTLPGMKWPSYDGTDRAKLITITPEKWFNHIGLYSYTRAIENQDNYRMLELGFVTHEATKADKSLNCDKRPLKFLDKSTARYASINPIMSYAGDTRFFMFAGDTNLYNSDGEALFPTNNGKFYNRTVDKILRHFVYSNSSYHLWSCDRNVDNFRLFATGEERNLTEVKYNFYLQDWYRHITPRVVSTKTITTNTALADDSKYDKVAMITSKYTITQKLDIKGKEPELKEYAAHFQHLDDNWDVIRIFKIKYDLDSHPDYGKYYAKAEAAAHASGGYAYTYTNRIVKEFAKLYLADHPEIKTIDNFEIPYKLVNEEERYFIHRKNKISRVMSYDSYSKEWKTGAIAYRNSTSLRTCQYLNLNDIATNTNLKDVISGVKKLIADDRDNNPNIPIAKLCAQSFKYNFFTEMTNNNDMLNLTYAFRPRYDYDSMKISSVLKEKFDRDKVSTKLTISDLFFGWSEDKIKIVNKLMKEDFDYYETGIGALSHKGKNCTRSNLSELFVCEHYVTAGIINFMNELYSSAEINAMTDEELTIKIKLLIAGNRISTNYTGNNCSPTFFLLPGCSESNYSSRGQYMVYTTSGWKISGYTKESLNRYKKALDLLVKKLKSKEKEFINEYFRLCLYSTYATRGYSTALTIDGNKASSLATIAGNMTDLDDIAYLGLKAPKGLKDIQIAIPNHYLKGLDILDEYFA